jgi:hypothetical protein
MRSEICGTLTVEGEFGISMANLPVCGFFSSRVENVGGF